VTKYQERRVSKATQQAAEAFKSLEESKANSKAITAQNLHPVVAATRRVDFVTSRRYIDILDDDKSTSHDAISGRRVDDILEEFAKTGSFVLEDSSLKSTPLTIQSNPEFTVGSSREEVSVMRKEIEQLRGLLSQYQNGESTRSQNLTPVTRHPGAEFGLPFEFAASFEKLASAGIDTRYIVEILEKANKELSGLEKKKRTLVDAWVARYILSHVNIAPELPAINKPQVHLFLGPSGHGKTASLVKFASQMVIAEKKRVVIMTADMFKVGASDQLKIYAHILGVPFETLRHSAEFPVFAAKYSSYDAILVDYPGLSLKDVQEGDQLRSLLPSRSFPHRAHLVLSCSGRDIDTYEAASRYQMTRFDDIIITKLDENTTHGLLYNIQRKTEKPLAAFGLGTKIPEDFEVATRERVLDLIYKISKTSKMEN
jgi:flagellar biosynthesis protein FlhF